MKINFKPTIDNSEQLNLRISPTLKQRIENLRAHSKELGFDCNATLIAYIEEFVTEAEAQLRNLYDSANKTLQTPRTNGAEPDRT